MIPRGRIDISCTDLAFATTAGSRGWRREELHWELEGLMGPRTEFLAGLSVRSGFDLLLESLALPAGTEVLMSAVTIRDMARIVREHGLVPVPVDLDMDTLSVDMETLERAASPKSRVIVVAHLFGSRMPLGEVGAFAREKGFLLVEDCAQAFTGLGWGGSPESDVCMFSFGPIKTHTSLGGALIRVRDPELMARMRALEQSRPIQPGLEFTRRAIKYCGIRGALDPWVYTALVGTLKLLGREHDDLVGSSMRGFAGTDFFSRIRRRPSTPLLATMRHRLTRFRDTHIQERTRLGERLLTLLPEAPFPGRHASFRSHWVFPVEVEDPAARMRELWEHGSDATQGATSITALRAPNDRPETEPELAHEVMSRTLFLPAYSGVPSSAIERLVQVVARWPSARRMVKLHV